MKVVVDGFEIPEEFGLPAIVRSYPALADCALYVRNELTLACFVRNQVASIRPS